MIYVSSSTFVVVLCALALALNLALALCASVNFMRWKPTIHEHEGNDSFFCNL